MSGSARFKSGDKFRVIAEIPDRMGVRKSILRELLAIYKNESGFFVQLRCWNEFSLDGGIVQMILALRRQHREFRSLEESPVCVFSQEELVLCLGLLDIILLFDWEGVWLSSSSSNVIWAYVDDRLILVANSSESLNRVKKEMAATGIVFENF